MNCGHCRMLPPGTPEHRFSRNFHHGDAPHMPYSPAGSRDKTTFHWGQRKLHLSEVDFLTQVIRKLRKKVPAGQRLPDVVMIYAGAAPARHTDLLSSMFPWVRMVLVDPARFAIEEKRYPDGTPGDSRQIRIINAFFTDGLARELRCEYSDSLRLFVSDIRSTSQEMGESQIENEVMRNMNAQMEWHRILEPALTMLKFRLPYVTGRTDALLKVPYLDGTIRYQIWAGPSSSETRLVCRGDAGTRLYDSKLYEDELYFWNHMVRPNHYKHPALGRIPELDSCYDCTAECVTHANYLANRDTALSWTSDHQNTQEWGTDYPAGLVPEIKRLVEELTHHLGDMTSLICFGGRCQKLTWREARREPKGRS